MPEFLWSEINVSVSTRGTATLEQLRQQIDALDRQLLRCLAERQQLVAQLFPLKDPQDLLATARRDSVLHTRRLWAEQLQLDGVFATQIFEHITAHFLHCQQRWSQDT